MNYQKLTPSKATLAAVTLAAILSLSSSNLAALSLGVLEIQSNLDQPLNGVIELHIADGEDLESVQASIASEEDFDKLGIDYPSYLNDLRLILENVAGRNVLRILSNDVVIKEPFIHLLVRVDWSGGSFLREYTALIDPPVYASETPRTLAEPQAVGTDQSYQAQEKPALEVEEPDQTEVVDEVFEQPAEEPTESETDAELGQISTDAQYGPVTSGETLSEIAAELQTEFPDLGIYQIMQVLFEQNRGAFIKGNINGLLMGSILYIGDLDAIRAVEVVQARQFFVDQLADWDPSYLQADSPSNDESLRVAADEYSYDDLLSDDASNDDTDAVIVSDQTDNGNADSFQVGSSVDTQSAVSAGAGDSEEGEIFTLQQQISDLQSSLSSASLENQELTERISLLEGQLADMNRLISLNVEDAELASLEASLAEQNNVNDELDNDVDANSGAAVAAAEEEVDVADQGDPLLSEVDSIEPLVAEDVGLESGAADSAEVDVLAEVVDLADQGDSNLSESDAVEVVSVAGSGDQPSEETVAAFYSEPSMLDKIKSNLMHNSLWRILTGLGVLLLAGLALLFFRNRRADREYEISMLSIETQSHSTDQEQEDKDEKTRDRDTSFLTELSASDAVVHADDVDPIAEADVYIAYGRDEQAEEVLLDGIAKMPERIDIKQKLLSLYNRNSNVTGFERVAEELYAQKELLSAEVWQEVSLMGKQMAPDNPLFDVSASQLLTEEGLTGAEQINLSAAGASKTPDAVGHDDETDAAGDEGESQAIKLALDDDDESINLINFDEGRSEISELDEVEFDALNLDEDGSEQDQQTDENSDVVDSKQQDIDRSEKEIAVSGDEDSELGNALEFEGIDLSEDPIGNDVDKISLTNEISELEDDGDYDEARTQYELAKVFVDLGDEDGARKILNDIVANLDNGEDVIADATKLLESMNS